VSAPAAPPDLTSADPLRRRAALGRLLLSDVGIDQATIAALVDCLGVRDKAVQRLATDLLERVDAAVRPALIARLEASLASDETDLRWGAAYALGRLGRCMPAMIGPLIDVLAERDGDRRWAAAGILTTCARADPERVLPALLAVATDPDAERRKMALYALRDAAPSDARLRAVTVHALADPAVGVRFAALAALVRLEPPPADACLRVLTLVRADPDAGLRRAALAALGDVGRGVSAAETAIAAAESSDDPLARRAASIARRRLAARTSAPPRSGRGSV
jgi:HEAT repeat protein